MQKEPKISLSKRKFFFTEMLKRVALEFKYFVSRGWSLKEVGDFWDSVLDYDDINESTYSYYRRFTNSWDLAKDFVSADILMLDIQSRSGKGTEFWYQKGLVKKAFLVDFSDYLLSLAKVRLENTGYNYELVKVTDYKLPFDDVFFDLVASYETIEHISNVDLFVNELARVVKPDGVIILTTPNILWEPVHWFAAIFNIHHSEGPHNFLRRKRLLTSFKNNNLDILEENSTVILPFNKKTLIAVNEKIEQILPSCISRLIALRRTFVLRKKNQA